MPSSPFVVGFAAGFSAAVLFLGSAIPSYLVPSTDRTLFRLEFRQLLPVVGVWKESPLQQV